MNLQTKQIEQKPFIPVGRYLKFVLLTVIVSVAANVIISLVTRVALHPDPLFLPLNPGPVGFVTAAAVVGAAIVYKIIMRYSRRPLRLFIIVALVVLLLSFIPDLTMLTSSGQQFPGTTVGNVVALLLMHITAGVVCIYTLTRAR